MSVTISWTLSLLTLLKWSRPWETWSMSDEVKQSRQWNHADMDHHNHGSCMYSTCDVHVNVRQPFYGTGQGSALIADAQGPALAFPRWSTCATECSLQLGSDAGLVRGTRTRRFSECRNAAQTPEVVCSKSSKPRKCAESEAGCERSPPRAMVCEA